MTPLSEYIIPIKGMKNGLHQYSFDVDKTFIDYFEYKELLDVQVHAQVNVFKNHRLFDIEIHIDGNVTCECDRCTDEVSIPVNFIHHLLLKVENRLNETEDIIYLPESTTEIDLSHYVYEALIFSVPMRRVHANDSEGKSMCNEDIINHLNKYLTQESQGDPRWDALKGLLN